MVLYCPGRKHWQFLVQPGGAFAGITGYRDRGLLTDGKPYNERICKKGWVREGQYIYYKNNSALFRYPYRFRAKR